MFPLVFKPEFKILNVMIRFIWLLLLWLPKTESESEEGMRLNITWIYVGYLMVCSSRVCVCVGVCVCVCVCVCVLNSSQPLTELRTHKLVQKVKKWSLSSPPVSKQRSEQNQMWVPLFIPPEVLALYPTAPPGWHSVFKCLLCISIERPPAAEITHSLVNVSLHDINCPR